MNDPNAGKDAPPPPGRVWDHVEPGPPPERAPPPPPGGKQVLKFLGGCAIAVLVIGALLFGTCLLIVGSH